MFLDLILYIFFLATASYRLLPDIQIIKPVKGEMADRLKNCFSIGVIEVIENKPGDPDSREARVKNPRYDSCSRNVFQHEDLKGCIRLSRIRNHIICKLKYYLFKYYVYINIVFFFFYSYY